MSLGLKVLPWKSTFAGLVPCCCLDGVVGFGGGGGMMTHDLFIRPCPPLQATGMSSISLRLRSAVVELVGDSASGSGSS